MPATMPATMPVTNRCTYCGSYFSTEQMLPLPGTTDRYCQGCWDRYCFRCSACGVVEWRPERSGERSLCRNCFPMSDTWEPTVCPVSIASYSSIASKRKYGVELETSSCSEYRDCKGKTLFGAKYDGSIRGMEFITPILYGDEGLAEIDKFCDYARQHRFRVNGECGYHLHIDVRDETSIQLRHIAYSYAKSYAVWSALTNENRLDNGFCHSPNYTADAIRTHRGSITRFFANSNRYNYLNLQAYDRHKTFEVRNHEGTLHAKTIKYWVLAHLRFVDYVKDLTYAQIDALLDGNVSMQFVALCRIWDTAGGTRISEFYRRRFNPNMVSNSENDCDDDCDDDCGDPTCRICNH